jgi:hypothetical protein
VVVEQSLCQLEKPTISLQITFRAYSVAKLQISYTQKFPDVERWRWRIGAETGLLLVDTDNLEAYWRYDNAAHGDANYSMPISQAEGYLKNYVTKMLLGEPVSFHYTRED